MLKSAQIPRPEFDADMLASEGFWLGDSRVEPRALRVVRGDDSQRLEPRVMQVLLVLARRSGRTVSREELLAEAWHGAVITDDSIYRAIHRLRSVLGADAHSTSAIETVPKIGYRLLLPVRALDAPVPAASAASAAPRRNALLLLAAALLVPAACIIAWWLSAPVSAPVAPAWMTLSMSPGLEHMPVFSPDGRQLIYSRGLAGREQLWLRALDGGAEVALTTPGEAMDYAADWSAGGERIAFLRQDEQRCRVMLMTLLQREPRQIGDCTPANGRLSLSPDGRRVVLSDRPDPDQRANALFLIDVDSGVRRSLPPPPAGQGDYRPRYSPDGAWIAFSRVDGRFQSSVLRRHSDGTGLEIVWSPPGFVHQVQWRGERELVATRRLGAANELWQLPLGGAPRLLAAIDNGVPSIDVSPDGRRLLLSVAVTQYRNRRLALTPQGKAGANQAMPPALDRARDLAVSPDGRLLALPWEARGESGVWLADGDGGQLRRLWSESGAYIRDLSWDPAGRRIAFERSRGNRQTVCVVDLDGLLQCLPEQERKRISPSWSGDGRHLFYVAEADGGWFAHRAAVDGSGEERLGRRQAMYATQAIHGGMIYLRPRGAAGIVALDPASGEERLIIDDAPHSRPRALVAARSGLYYLRGDGMLMHYALPAGPATPLTSLGSPLPRTLSLSAAEDLLLYSEVTGEEADIALLTNLDALIGAR